MAMLQHVGHVRPTFGIQHCHWGLGGHRQASFPGSSGSKSLRFQGSSQGRAALLTAFCRPCDTAATCRPCRPAASMRTLQQACRPCSSLMQQACRPLQQAYSCRVCRLSASLQTLQQPAGPADPAARRPYRPYSKPAKPAACLSPSPHGFQSSITWAFSCIYTESISPCKHKGLKAPESAGSLKAPDL